MNAPILALDWIYIGTAQTLALAITNVGDYDFSAATVGVSTDGSQFQDTSALLEKTTTMGYKPVFPVYMGSEWLVPEGQKLYVNVLVGSESVQSEYTVHQALPVQAKVRANTLSTGTVIENLLADATYVGSSVDESAGGIQIMGSEDNMVYMLSDQVEDQTITLGSTDYYAQICASIMYYFNISFANHKLYISVDANIDYNLATINVSTGVFFLLSKNGNRHSILIDANSLVYAEGDMACIYTTYFILSTESFTPLAQSEIVINHPILIDITANQSLFTSLGLTTDEEIQAYLDAIPYESFPYEVNQPSGGLTYPENLLVDLEFTSEVDLTKNIASGSADNYAPGIYFQVDEDLSLVASGLSVIGEDVDYSDYRQVCLLQDTQGSVFYMILSKDKSLTLSSKKIYMRFSTNIPSEWGDIYGSMLIVMPESGSPTQQKILALRNRGDVLSSVVDYPEVVEGNAINIASAGIYQEKTKTAPSSIGTDYYINQAVIVDITANQDYFTAQGLSTDEEIRAHLDSIPYSSFGQPATPIVPEPIGENKYVDGIGLGFLWEEMKDYIESQLSASGTILPIPLSSYELSDDKFTATIMLDITYTGYDSVTVRYKKGSEPTETDPEISQTEGVQVDDVGTYYIRAFGGSYTPSPSYKLNVTGLKVQTPVISIVPTSTIQITCATAGADIRYTLDGTDPTQESAQYTEPFEVADVTTLKAKAFKEGFIDSDVATPSALKLWDRLSDGSVVCYDRGEQYGSYILQDGEAVKTDSGSDWRYMICEEYDLNHYETGLGTGGVDESYSGKEWGFYGTTTNVQDTAIGTGKDNTDQLISLNNNDSDTLWYYVNQHRTSTGKQWHVPSKDELNVLYENLTQIGNFSVPFNPWYWSSSEYLSYTAWIHRFSFGSQENQNKNITTSRVRCVRFV